MLKITTLALAAGLVIAALTPGPVFAQATAAAQEDEREDEQDASSKQDALSNNSAGAVFAMTNETDRNRIVVYRRANDGTLTLLRSVRTRGLGIGVDTDTQGPLVLSRGNRFLYAVNPGSDNISVFKVNGTRLKFLQIVDAGDQPLALTLSRNLLYVLNGSVAGNGITGFRVSRDGTLTPLPDSFRALSSPIAVPGNIQFSPDGKVILVTHKTTNVLLPPQDAIDAFAIGNDGYAGAVPLRNASFGLRPFSLAFREDGKLVVVEAFNAAPDLSAASSYQLNADGTLDVISGSVANGQTDVCWVVITNDGRYAFVANFGSGTISSYRLTASGALTLLNGSAAFLGDMSQPVDLSLSRNGRFLYQLLRGTGAVAAFRIENNGSLTDLGVVEGVLPVADGASGLAAY
ncbi:MAG: beta-propeller fold lactonase family protein [Gammaproteobacteria bacterium]|nr:beta-propeller fold lactonase family protein [Gammaproteobacteria bacterium]